MPHLFVLDDEDGKKEEKEELLDNKLSDSDESSTPPSTSAIPKHRSDQSDVPVVLESLEIMDPIVFSPYTVLRNKAVIFAILTEMLLLFAIETTVLPANRVIENSICERWYLSHPKDGIRAGWTGGEVDEGLCKTDIIQADLVSVNGWLETVGNLVSLFVLVPSTYFAKRIDRRLFLFMIAVETAVYNFALGLVASHTSIDPRWVWPLPLLDFIGGGWSFLGILVRTTIAENLAKEQVGAAYYCLRAGLIFAAFLGNTLGSWLMKIIPAVFVVYFFAITGSVLSLPPIALLPIKNSRPGKSLYEAIPGSPKYSTIPNAETPESEDAGDIDSDETLTQPPAPPSPGRTVIHRMVYRIRNNKVVNSVFHLCINYAPIRHCLIILALQIIASGIRVHFRTWISKRYDWTLSTTGIVVSIENLAGGLLTLALPYLRPWISKMAQRKNLTPDLLIAMFSVAATIGGAMIVTLAYSPVILIIGLLVGSPSVMFIDAIKAHIIAMAEMSEIMDIHTVFVIVEVCALLINGPLWITVFNWTYAGDHFGLGLGLPAAMTAVILVGTLFYLKLGRVSM